MTSLVVDTSALIAILANEEEALSFSRAIVSAHSAMVSSATVHEANCVVARGSFGRSATDVADLISDLDIRQISFAREQVDAARDAYVAFGRGSGHPARLNMGDCFSYALARTRDLPLLFKGDDFIHTDIRPALAVDP
ncbi:type II toxin-antitoxin system VapC family toxin [Oricola sp.]|uniref:type II toxin-antitoxin system VapC family toxin n=1 Tax=Oricola sp. TaxID=1979950 RepID=UPI0025FAB9AA|nr:type II toxin-antitoxin system VapC family toxin [Oricola sp.]MCI5077687.1 type II toxin-antitoxin system VapC family toxin [Oricola sp.]